LGRITVLVSLLLSSACAQRPQVADAVTSGTVLRLDDHVDVGPGVRRVIVRNLFGDVHLRRSKAAIVSYHAVVQSIEPGLPPAQVRVQPHADRIEVAVEIEGVRLTHDEIWNPRRARLDLALAIPDKLELDVRTSFGSIGARGLLSPIRARSVGGRIQLSTGGAVDVESERGDVGLVQRLREYQGEMRVRTQGRISATIPFDAGYAIRARTCGGFDLGGLDAEVSRDESGCQSLDTRVGDGGHVLELWSSNGQVTLRDHSLIGD
jgi:hypothetical protein